MADKFLLHSKGSFVPKDNADFKKPLDQSIYKYGTYCEDDYLIRRQTDFDPCTDKFTIILLFLLNEAFQGLKTVKPVIDKMECKTRRKLNFSPHVWLLRYKLLHLCVI